MDRKEKIYDLIIVGAGPAGVTAAIYAARKKIDFMLIATNIGGQVTYSSEIENYTGFQFITGEELSTKLEEHLKKFKFDIKLEEVQSVERDGRNFRAKTENGEYTGKTIIVATGRRPRELGIPGEQMFKNRGLTYCETCDGPLFEGLDIAIVGGGNSGFEAALQLMKIAKSVRILEMSSEIKADPVYVDKAKASGRVEIMTRTQVLEILGDKTINGVRLRQEGKSPEILKVQGVFVEIGSVPNSHVVEFVGKNQYNEIIADSKCRTNVSGFFAAGDVTDAPEKQIVVAAGDGCKAALSAFRYLSQA